MNKWRYTLSAMALMAFTSLGVGAEEKHIKPVDDRKAAQASKDPAYLFAPKMQSFRLYGDAAIPNSIPRADEETGAETGWIQKVSQPYIQVYLPAKVKATGASVLIFSGWGILGADL